MCTKGRRPFSLNTRLLSIEGARHQDSAIRKFTWSKRGRQEIYKSIYSV